MPSLVVGVPPRLPAGPTRFWCRRGHLRSPPHHTALRRHGACSPRPQDPPPPRRHGVLCRGSHLLQRSGAAVGHQALQACRARARARRGAGARHAAARRGPPPQPPLLFSIWFEQGPCQGLCASLPAAQSGLWTAARPRRTRAQPAASSWHPCYLAGPPTAASYPVHPRSCPQVKMTLAPINPSGEKAT